METTLGILVILFLVACSLAIIALVQIELSKDTEFDLIEKEIKSKQKDKAELEKREEDSLKGD